MSDMDKKLSYFPWKDGSDWGLGNDFGYEFDALPEESKIAFHKKFEPGAHSGVSTVFIFAWDLSLLRERGPTKGWMVDTEMNDGEHELIWHNEKAVPDRATAEKYVDMVKKFVDVRTVDQLKNSKKLGPLSLSRLESRSPRMSEVFRGA